MDKQHLLILTSTLPRWNGDSEAPFVLNLAKHLAKFMRITILAPHHKGAELQEEINGINIIRFKYWFENKQSLCYGAGMYPNFKKNLTNKIQLLPFLYFQWKAIKKIVKKDDVDIINAWWLFPQGLLAYKAFKKFGIPYILSSPGTDLFLMQKKFFKFFIRRILQLSQNITVLSRYMERQINEYIFSGLVKVIPIGIESHQYTYIENDAIPIKILSVGRLTEQKGFHILIKALAILKKKGLIICLDIIGEGTYKLPLLNLLNECELENEVKFLGAIPNSEIEQYYHSAGIFVLPSIGYEGLGLVLIEAIACGTPVIGSNVGGIPDIIINRKTGLLVPDNDPVELAKAIEEMIINTDLRRRCSKNAKKHIKRFEWKNIAKEFNNILQP